MLSRIVVPHLDANIPDVTVTAWRKAPGDRVQTGEIVVDLTTDKTTFELESAASGILLEILAAPKSVVPSGYILALIGAPGETDTDAVGLNQTLMVKYRTEAGNRKAETGHQPSRTSAHPLPTPAIHHLPPDTPATRVRATPRARRLAQEQGLDLAQIQAATGATVIDEAVLQAYRQQIIP